MKYQERSHFPVCLRAAFQVVVSLLAILYISPSWAQDVGVYIERLKTVCETAGSSGEAGLMMLDGIISVAATYSAGLAANQAILIKARDDTKARAEELKKRREKEGEAFKKAAIEYYKAKKALDDNIDQQIKLNPAIEFARNCIEAQRSKIKTAQPTPQPSSPSPAQSQPPSPPPKDQSSELPEPTPPSRYLMGFNVSCEPPMVEAGVPSTCTASGVYSDDPTKVVNLTDPLTTWEKGTNIFRSDGLKPNSYPMRASRDGMSGYGTVTVIEGLDGYDAIEDLKNKGNKGVPVDPNIAKDFQDKQPGAKPPDTTGQVSSGPPQERPDAKEPPGGDKEPTSTSSVPASGQSGMSYQCPGDDGTYVLSPVPCPQKGKSPVPAYTPPQGGKPEKDPDRMRKPTENTAKTECEKKGKIYHQHADGKMWCCDTNHGIQGQKTRGH